MSTVRPFRNMKTYGPIYDLIKIGQYETAAKKWFNSQRTNYNNTTLMQRVTNRMGANKWYKFEVVKNARKKRMSNYMNDKLASQILNFINSLNNASKRGTYQSSKQNLRSKLKNILLQKPSNRVENKIMKARSVYYTNLRNGIVIGTGQVGYVKPITRNASTQTTPSNRLGYKRSREIRSTLF